MTGTLVKTEVGWFVKYLEDMGNIKRLHITDKVNEMYANPFIELPYGRNEPVHNGMTVEFQIALTLKKGAVYTTADGWNGDPIEGQYAQLVFQKEVTDEDIETYARDAHYPPDFISGAKWMREQLKRKYDSQD